MSFITYAYLDQLTINILDPNVTYSISNSPPIPFLVPKKLSYKER